MLTNRHKQAGIRGAGAKAQAWPCRPETRRDAAMVAAVGVCLSPTSAYLLGGMTELQGAVSIENPRFADRRENQI